MALAQRVGNDYNNIHIEGGRIVLGNVYGQSPDERAFAAILDSLRYDGMTDRRDTLAEAQEGTFDWTFLEGETKFLRRRWMDHKGVVQDDFRKVEMSFKAWLEARDEGLFCVMGKPGSGKSTFM
jgi:dephospho-CoA kinase